MGLRLLGPVKIDDLTLATWGSLHKEEVATWYPTMGFRGSPWFFWPMRVAGSVLCYSWHEDGIETAAARLRGLVETLSLAFDWPMEVRVGPYESSIRVAGDDRLVVPGLSAPVESDDSEWRPDWQVEIPEWGAAPAQGSCPRSAHSTSNEFALRSHALEGSPTLDGSARIHRID